jgi:hypothetical protein
MWRDAFRPDTFGVLQKAARSKPLRPVGARSHAQPALSRASTASGVDRTSRALWHPYLVA